MRFRDSDRSRKESEMLAPDATWGTIVVVLALAGLALIVFVPAREGASPSAKFYLAGFAVLFLAYGVRLIVAARAWKKRQRTMKV
jgi:hypothetical protein